MKPMRDTKTNRTVKWTTILAVAAALLLTGLAFQRTQDAARAQTGGGYTLGGGFWGGGALAAQHQLYLPLVMRNYQ